MKNIISLIIVFCSFSAAEAILPPTLLSATRPEAFTNEAGEVLLYRKAAPHTTKSPVPLIVFLHGAGERGSDNTNQLVHGIGPLLDHFTRRHEPVEIIAPQCEANRRWVEVDWNLPAHTLPAFPSKMMRLALQLTEETVRRDNIDRARIYLAGLSMGGFGTWDAAMRRPDLFAAIMPVCGGGDRQAAWRLKDMPALIVHGAADPVVSPRRSHEMAAALRALDAPVRFIEYPRCQHASWAPAFSDDALLNWLFAHRRTDALPRAEGLTPRIGEPFTWELAPGNLTPAAYLERIRTIGAQLRRAQPHARIVCRRDGVSEEFRTALDAFGEGEEYAWREGPSTVRVLSGTLDRPLLAAGDNRAYLLDPSGTEIASWPGCGNIHQALIHGEYLWWSNGRLWRTPLAGGKPECVYRAEHEVGGGVLGFDLDANGHITLAVNATREIVELAPPRDFPPRAPFTVCRRFKVDARTADGREPSAHGALRMIRKLANGNILVCCASAAKAREYTPEGKAVWEVSAPPFAFDCLRTKRGTTYVSHLDGVTEFAADGNILWQLKTSDFPHLRLAYLCGLSERPNGNLVIGSWANGGPAREKATAFEVTREKRIVWAHYAADVNMMSARIVP